MSHKRLVCAASTAALLIFVAVVVASVRPAASQTPAPPDAVAIHFDGARFTPDYLMVYVGTTFEWRNDTSTTFTLIAEGDLQSSISQVFLPTILTGARTADSAEAELHAPSGYLFLPIIVEGDPALAAADGATPDLPITLPVLLTLPFPPGSVISYTVNGIGHFSFRVAELQGVSGQVDVFDKGDPFPPTPTPTTIATATPIGGSTATPTGGSAATPTGAPADTGTPTATSTNTPVDTATPTQTGIPTDTPTSTPTFTPTSTPTTTPTPTPTQLALPTPTATAPQQPLVGLRLSIVNVPSTIIANTTWTPDNLYLVSGLATLNSGVTLSLQPGVVIKFQNSGAAPGRLIVNGNLIAQGTQHNPIILTSIHDDAYGGDTNLNNGGTWPKAGDWAGLDFTQTSTGSVLDYVTLLHAGYGGIGASLTVTNTSVALTNSRIAFGAADGVRLVNGVSGTIADNRIDHHLLIGLSIKGASSPTVSNNTFDYNRTYALALEANSFPIFAGNTVYSNGVNGIRVFGSVGTGLWYANLPYVAGENMTIEAGSTLTLQPGTVVKLSANQNFVIRGALVAAGTATDAVVFTSLKDDAYGGDTQQDSAATKPNPGDWGTIYFDGLSNGSASVLDHVLVRYGGMGYKYSASLDTVTANLSLNSTTPRILNSTFEFSNQYGVQMINGSAPLFQGNTLNRNVSHALWIGSAAAPQVQSNAFLRSGGYAVYVTGSSQATFSGNAASGNKVNGIGRTGTLNADTTWAADLPYVVVDATLTLAQETTLTLQPGVVLKFAQAGRFTVNGTLQALGTAALPIFFTSLKDDTIFGDTNNDNLATAPAKGDWESVRFVTSAGGSVLTYVTLRYGGSNATTGAIFLDGSTPSLSHLTLTGSLNRGLFVQNASPLIKDAIFSENGTGVYNSATAFLIVQNSAFYSNTLLGLNNANAAYTLDATANWWGSATGPKHASNLEGAGDDVSNGVNYGNWLITPPFALPNVLPTFPSTPIYTQVNDVLTTNTTWTLAQSPYLIVTRDATVSVGVQLTIEPGVVVKFGPGRSLIVNGILSAVGTPAQHILFTSLKDDAGTDANFDGDASWPRPGDWGRILFGNSSDDAATTLQFVEVRFGGSTGSGVEIVSAAPTIVDSVIARSAGYGVKANTQAAPNIQRNLILDNTGGGVWLGGTSTATLSNNRLWGNGGYAVYMDASCYPDIADNDAFDNVTNGVRVSGGVAFSQTWSANLPYVIEGNLTISNGPALILQPGVLVKFKDTSSLLSVYGALIADGADDSPITFTSIRDDDAGGDTDNNGGIFWPAPGDWQRIDFTAQSDDTRTLLRHATIRYGGSASLGSIVVNSAAPHIISNTITLASGHGLYLLAQANPLVEENTILQNGASGLYMTGAAVPTLNNNVFQRNRAYAVEMMADSKPHYAGNTALDNSTNAIRVWGNTAGDTTWDANLPYLSGGVGIPTTSKLIILAGAIVKFPPAAGWYVSGTLSLSGTPVAPVVLTSYRDDTYGGDTNNDGSYSAPTSSDTGLIPFITFSGTSIGNDFTSVIVRFGTSPAVQVNQASLTVANSRFEQNRLALRFVGSTSTVTATTFINNTEYALYETASSLTIQNNRFEDNLNGVYIRTATALHSPVSGNAFVANQQTAYWTDVAGLSLVDGTNRFDNRRANVVRAEAGTMITDTSFYSGTVYRLDGLIISPSVTLTVQSNAIVKMITGTKHIAVQGTLLVSGTSTYPSVFTSERDDSYGGDSNYDGSATVGAPGDWGTLIISATGRAQLAYAVVRFGGSRPCLNNNPYSCNGYAVGVYNKGGSLTIANSTIVDNNGYGVYSMNGGLSIVDSQIARTISSTTSAKIGTEPFLAPGTGVWVDASGNQTISPTLWNNTFYTNTGEAVHISGANGNYVAGSSRISGNNGTGNGINGIAVNAVVTGAVILATNHPNFPYVLDNISVPYGQSLTLAPGVVMKGMQNSGNTMHNLVVTGTLNALGSQDNFPNNLVVFTSGRDDSFGGDSNNDGSTTVGAPGDWGTLFIESTGTVQLVSTVMRFGGSRPCLSDNPYSCNGYAVGVYNKGGSLTIANSTIVDNNGYGVYSMNGGLSIVDSQIARTISSTTSAKIGTEPFLAPGTGVWVDASGNQTISPTLRNNTFYTNTGEAMHISGANGNYVAGNSLISGNNGTGNGINGIAINAVVTGAVTLATNHPNFPYVLDNISVPYGQSLTLAPGVVMKGMQNSGNTMHNLVVTGTLNALGSQDNLVVFTSGRDDSFGGDTNNDGSTTGAPGDWGTLVIEPTGAALLQYAVVRFGGYQYCPFACYGYDKGVYNKGGVLTITHTTIASNNGYGVYDVNGTTSIHDSNIYSNTNGVFNANASPILDAENNWWGSASGPQPLGTGDSINSNVDADPWLAAIAN